MGDWLPLTLNGTVFSGDPCATTLGNTLRSICYVAFYAYLDGISVKCIAAGDDVLVLP